MTTPLGHKELLSGTLPPGTQLRNYQLVSHLATGGMAELYLARAVGIENFERLVVIKRILPHWARDPQFVAMFLDEARLAAQLHHPNIAQVFDIGEDSGTYFFAMEFVHGEDLRALLKRNQRERQSIPMDIAVSIVIETASALHHAHEASDAQGASLELVHRDVSPSNVLLSFDGGVKVVDFGIAKAANRQQETRTGCLKGKISYMAPEQCRGEELDRRADVFALGILLYEATTGRRLFDGKSDFGTLELIVNGVITPPREHVADYPPELEHILRRALALDPSERYQTAEALAADLEDFAASAGLSLSSRRRARYLRKRFTDKLEAWESAQLDGKSLATHLSESALYQLTPSGVAPMSPSGLTPSYSAFAFKGESSEPEQPTRADRLAARATAAAESSDGSTKRRSPVIAAILATALAGVLFVFLAMPRLGWGPWASASAEEDAEREAAAAKIEAESRARADAEKRAAEAEARASSEAEARKRIEAEAKKRAEEKEAAEAAAAAAALAAEAEEQAKKDRRARRRRKATSTKSTSDTKKDWQSNSLLLPSQAKKKKKK